MKFIVKDEPAGWAISVWVMDDRPTGWMLMVADSVVHGEIVWRWDSIHENQELPQPTFRFNWDFVEEFAQAIIKKHPKRVDDVMMETLNIERSRVDKLLGYLTHQQLNNPTASQVHTPPQPDEILSSSNYDVNYIKQENQELKKQVQELQSVILKMQTDVMEKKNVPKGAMQHADSVLQEVYGPQATYSGGKSNKSAFQEALKQEMAQFPISPPKLVVSPTVKEEFLKTLTSGVIAPHEFSKVNLAEMGFQFVDPDSL